MQQRHDRNARVIGRRALDRLQPARLGRQRAVALRRSGRPRRSRLLPAQQGADHQRGSGQRSGILAVDEGRFTRTDQVLEIAFILR